MSGHLWLVGMMGSGKTSIGKRVAERVGVDFFDTDDEVSARAGCSVARLWGERGEAAFRQMESAAIARLAAGATAVIATGGGAVLDSDNVATMRETGTVVWLTASPASLARRVRRDGSRPLLDGGDPRTDLEEILAKRKGMYEAAAHVVVDTEARRPEAVAEAIEASWKRC